MTAASPNPAAGANSVYCDCGDEAPASVWWRIGAGAFLAMNAMVLGLAVNGSETTPEERFALELSILLVACAVLTLLAKEFAQATWENWKQRRFGIEGLFLLGIAACLAVSALSLQTGAGGTFADVAAMLLVIYSLGRQIGAYGKSRVLRSLDDWAPNQRYAHVKAGDRLTIFPGEVVPVDGKIVAGRASFQEASLTGEAFTSPKGPGEAVQAGIYPVDGSVEIEATSSPAESSLEQIRRLVLAGLARPGKEQRVALAVLRFFAPAVLLTAVGTFLYQSARVPMAEALFHSLSVVVIACPCALGFATPLAVWTAIARLRELGILARSGDAVERLAEIDTVVFDKTGTLTIPEAYVVRLEVEPAWQDREEELQALLAAAEEGAPHPIARAFASQAKVPAPKRKSLKLIPGQGIDACFEDGTYVSIATGEAYVNGSLAARIHVEETVCPSAAPAVRTLESAGLRVILSTGDNAERAEALPIGERLAKQTPFDKHALLSNLSKEGRRVLFAGDGLNDSAAMAWSHVSMTVPTSPSLVREMSSLVLLDHDWAKLPQAIAVAREARKLVRANIAFSLAYNALGMGLAAVGILHPVAAALIMLFSSLTVILYSMRLMDQECSLA
jgi:Cu2+-exporting ATPase/Cu+-exporting ATPase